ncbi:MAG: undecaprenyl-phosphate galactose phosphotransferase WbaP [Acidobacteriia bacterium]|nr:undecaprenyl-phosphate galactose phosphotransferase WbaP [Terriglobia bacterium]
MASIVSLQIGLVRRAAAGPSSAVRMGAVHACVDLFTLSLAVSAGFWSWSLINPATPPHPHAMWLAVALASVGLTFYGLYPGIGMTAVEQMRRTTHGITLVYILLLASMFVVRDWWAASRGALLLSWALCLLFVPPGRWIADRYLRSRSWWGVPVMILGAGETARMIVRKLREQHVLGYRPVLCLDDDPQKHGSCQGVPVLGSLEEAAYFARIYQTNRAIVAMPGLSRESLVQYLERWSQIFPKIMIVPDLFGVASLWIEPRDLGGVLGLVIRCNLLNPVNRSLKRVADVVISGVGLLLSSPLLAVAAWYIKRASPGPAFYTQAREGRNGQLIHVVKLRTMYPQAEEMLSRYLAENAGAREEWTRFCKLKRDPRIIPGIGHFLRTTSLDELPQLWNVLRGDMSLVGPRPFPRYHNERFHDEFRALRTRVTPGLTGLWQISARSDGDLDAQKALDSYYIRNWSPWLDAYILVCTIRTVLAREGAY